VIDLHLHTTASDGRLTPRALVDRAAAAGVTVLAVTDHDTTAAVSAVRSAAAARGVVAVAGIEITAVDQGRDVHVLGYFLDHADAALAAFLAGQRELRLARIEAIAGRLAALGLQVDVTPLIEASRRAGGAVGRPHVARALVEAGHAVDAAEAFDRWLGEGRPAYVARRGAPPEEVIRLLHDAGGLASLAHPGRNARDARIAALRGAGLDAIEVYHPEHDAALVERYARLASDLDCLVTGGSDFHGDGHGGSPGATPLPAAEWDRLLHRRHG
jgi:hypothetical protein